jgi:hypothetical protein
MAAAKVRVFGLSLAEGWVGLSCIRLMFTGISLRLMCLTSVYVNGWIIMVGPKVYMA